MSEMELTRKLVEVRHARGFEIVYAWKKHGNNIAIPQRKTAYSAAYDIASADYYVIEPLEVRYIATGLKAYMQPDEVLLLNLRSGFAGEHMCSIPQDTGIIDSDYYNNPKNEGHIMVPIINLGGDPVVITEGMRIAQAMFTKYLITDNDKPGGMHLGGFNSTGYYGKHKDDEPEDR